MLIDSAQFVKHRLRFILFSFLSSVVLGLGDPCETVPIAGVVGLHCSRCGAAIQYDIRCLLFQASDMLG